MRLKVILVEPMYQINLGYLARTAMNFGIEKLYMVRPRAKINGKQAITYAKHAYELLQNAKIYRSISEAIKDCDIVIGTTGVWRKAKSGLGNVDMAERVVEKVAKVAKERTVVGLLIGRDNIGLTKEELSLCDIVAYIGTDERYPVMNISHALAVMLYLFTREHFSETYTPLLKESPRKGEVEELFRIFAKSLKGKKIRDKNAVIRVFKRIINRAQPSEQEIHALITALK